MTIGETEALSYKMASLRALDLSQWQPQKQNWKFLFFPLNTTDKLIPNIHNSGISNYTIKSEVAQLCPTLCHPMDCSLPHSSVHGILQTRLLEWVAISFSSGSSWPRDQTWVSHIAGRHFTLWPTRKPSSYNGFNKTLIKTTMGGLPWWSSG